MENISLNLQKIQQKLPQQVTLCAVSKFHPNSSIMELYDSGHRVFAESRPQEFMAKAKELPSDIIWHFIGHLQTNKVKMVVPFAEVIESVDSVRLLEAISKEAVKLQKTQKVLLQMHIATEESKQGFTESELMNIINSPALPNIEIVGLMGMASYSNDMELVRGEFNCLKRIYDLYPHFTVLSIGMSGDWELAVECGSNNVRVGSAIFGARY